MLGTDFEEDRAASATDLEEKRPTQKERAKTVTRVAQEISKRIALNPFAQKVVKTIGDHAEVDLDHKELRDTVKRAIERHSGRNGSGRRCGSGGDSWKGELNNASGSHRDSNARLSNLCAGAHGCTEPRANVWGIEPCESSR